MLRRLISWKLDSVERELGVSMDYLRHILRYSLPGFMKFAKIIPLAEFRRELPAEPYFVAVLVATQNADCGTCVQIGVNQAKKAGIRADIINAVIQGRPDELPDELADVYRFAASVVQADNLEGELREKIRDRYGEAGLVEMALAMGVSRIFPTTKRALGYAKSCAAVSLEV